MEFDAEELAALLELLTGTDFSYFQYEKGDVRITLTRGEVPHPQSTSDGDAPTSRRSRTTQPKTSAPAPISAATTRDSVRPDVVADDGPVIQAPMMGTFYSAPRPGEPAFVAPGDAVEPHTVVGIIEVMKLMTPVVAGIAGVISAIHVENGQLVEFEQPLFQVKTSA